MRKWKTVFLVVCAVALWPVAAAQGAELVDNWDLDDLDGDSGSPETLAGWSSSGWGDWYDYTDGSGDSLFSWGWWGDQQIWQNTTATFEADTIYTMTAKARKGDVNMYGFKLQLIDITDGWVNVVDQENAFVLPTFGDNSPWEEFSFDFDTAINPGVVGHTIGVAVTAMTDASGHPVAWIQVDSVSLVPEPTTVALLGIGGLCCLRRRR